MANKIKVYNPTGTVNRITQNDKLGLFLSETWVRYFAKYTPMKTGILKSNITTEPFTVTYNSPYAHYQWEGEKYVDPLYGVGGFYDPNYGWWSRPGIEKEPSGEDLVYSKEQNPLATSHWEQAAAEAFRDDVAEQVSEFLRSI